MQCAVGQIGRPWKFCVLIRFVTGPLPRQNLGKSAATIEGSIQVWAFFDQQLQQYDQQGHRPSRRTARGAT